MSTSRDYLSQVQAATKAAVADLTAELQRELISRGWPSDAALSVTLKYSNDKLDFEFSGDSAEKAKTLEYGSERQRPTAEIRKFLSRTSLIEEVFLTNLEKRIGELV